MVKYDETRSNYDEQLVTFPSILHTKVWWKTHHFPWVYNFIVSELTLLASQAASRVRGWVQWRMSMLVAFFEGYLGVLGCKISRYFHIAGDVLNPINIVFYIPMK